MKEDDVIVDEGLVFVSWNDTFIYEWTVNEELLTGWYDDDGDGVRNSSNTGVLTLAYESEYDVWFWLESNGR